jgi:hypothetical protein
VKARLGWPLAMRSAGAIGILVLAVLPGSAAAAVVDPVSVSRFTTVAAGETRSLTLTCPARAVALHGAATSELRTDSIPSSNPQRWRFRFTNGSRGPQRAGGVVRCVRLRLPEDVGDIALVVGTVRLPDAFVVAGATRKVSLTCQRGMIPTGWGIERGDAGRTIAVAAASPTRRGFTFMLENTGDRGARATPRIRCLERTERASSGKTLSFATRVATFEDGGNVVRHACRRKEYSVSAGVSLDPAGDLVLDRATPRGERGGLWRFSGSGSATTSLICLARGTRFR